MSVDIAYWYSTNREKGCPSCGMDLRSLAPEQNLFNHYSGTCKPHSYFPPPIVVQKGSETSAILEAIAALAEGIRARDKQWDAVSEQIRRGFGGPSVQNPLGLTLGEQLHGLTEAVKTAFEGLSKQLREQDAALRANLQQALNYRFDDVSKVLKRIDEKSTMWASVNPLTFAMISDEKVKQVSGKNEFQRRAKKKKR